MRRFTSTYNLNGGHRCPSELRIAFDLGLRKRPTISYIDYIYSSNMVCSSLGNSNYYVSSRHVAGDLSSFEWTVQMRHEIESINRQINLSPCCRLRDILIDWTGVA